MLNMQLLRDLRCQWSRYLASALLILLGIVVSAGMAAGNGSALNTAKDAQHTGNVEDGYLELTAELTNDQLTSLRNKGLTFERAEFTDVPAADNSTVRVYENRSTIDRINLESGALPTANDEIALEQTYARAHNLKVGDTLDLDGTRLTITGIGSTPDYATVVARPTDTAADPNEFGTAFTAVSTVESLAKQGNTLTTTYVYLLGDSDMEATDIVSEISNALRDHAGTAQVSSYLEHDDNPRIVTVIDDQTVTVQAAYIAGFVALVLIAYVLSVLTADNIRRQSPVIGTFYALGITRRELIAHYMLLPVILAAVCAVAGTVGGFLAAPAMQNATTYYSIPALGSVVSPGVIAYGVLTPLITVTLVSFLVLRRKLAKEPLQLLRRDTGQRPPSRATLESLPFAFSFRLRSFMRAWTTYVLMLLGVVLSLLLMVFSFGMHDSVVSYADDVREDIDFEVVYVFLGAPPTSPDGAETATLRSAKLVGAEGAGASLSVIGIDKDTQYFDVDLSGTDETHVLISKAVSLRYGYEVGDEFTLDPMDTDNRKVVVAGIVDYPQMAVFGEHEDVNSLLGLDRGSSNAIVSGTVNDDLDNQAQSVISRSDMITSVNTFTQAMRPTILVLFIASIGLFIIVMFLLMRMVVDREQYSISLMKALGYDEAKVGHLYLGNYILLVLLSLTVGLPLSVAIMRPTWQYMISSLATAFPFTTSSRSVILIVVIVLATYGVVRFLSGRHLRGVDVTEILKDRE
ncbi:ABC transporter permease [Actinomyces oris]|uniref:ABC transporter permease n=2 Tax=Actinomycetaceae TaxID=2049 RepID=A0A1Q8V7D3_9ACTO|nr:efflux ABC transporter, permease protein [Actinomyces sp. oral taxon 171 str. F0337]OLO43990.1 ABC transporter permease [Actinomyces oris]